MTLDSLIGITAVLSNVAAFFGIPLAIWIFVRDRQQVRVAREQETYRALQSEYSNFLRLCLENPDLPLHDYDPDTKKALTPDQQKRRMVAFEILVSMLESAFFLYNRDHASEFKRRQWTGWDHYLREWAGRRDFQACWQEHLGGQFDSEFVAYMGQLVANAKKRA